MNQVCSVFPQILQLFFASSAESVGGLGFREPSQRVIQGHLPNEGLPKELCCVVETNLIESRTGKINGAVDPNSGGFTWNGAVTLQLPTLRWELGMAVILPIVQQLNGVDRIPEGNRFISFFEYYLSAPSWNGFRRK